MTILTPIPTADLDAVVALATAYMNTGKFVNFNVALSAALLAWGDVTRLRQAAASHGTHEFLMPDGSRLRVSHIQGAPNFELSRVP